MDTLNRDDFAAHLDTNFTIYFLPDEPTEAKLIQVTELKVRPQGQSFAILFQGPPERTYYQRMMRVEHPELGSGELFLVPVAQVADGVQYEAAFNRVTEK
jgi:hypothetical protein